MNVTVTRHSDGHWYAALNYEQTLKPRTTSPGPVSPAVGVDLGVKTAAVAATADGAVVAVVAELVASRALRGALRKVIHLQRHFSRTQKGSANRRKAAARLARAHATVAARRADALHAFTSRLARGHDVIGVEDLAVANMLRNRHLAAAIADQGWGELRRQLGYKTDRHGGVLVLADRWYPSTKTCSSRGAVKAKLSLAVRTYTCDSSGLAMDGDVNAAANLAAWAEHAQAGDRHPGGPSAESPRPARGGDNEPARPTGVLAGVSGEAGTSQLAINGAA